MSFDVAIDWTNVIRTGDRTDTQHATLDLVANADIATTAGGVMDIVQRFETPKVSGDGELGQMLQHTGQGIASASVITRIAADGSVVSSRIENASDEDVRSIVGNLGQLITFRYVRAEPVAVGDEWDKTWTDTATGAFETGAHYRLNEIVACGASRCGVIDVRGRDSDAKSSFRGQLVVELDSLRPVSKHVESIATSSGEQEGTRYEVETKTILTAKRR